MVSPAEARKYGADLVESRFGIRLPEERIIILSCSGSRIIEREEVHLKVENFYLGITRGTLLIRIDLKRGIPVDDSLLFYAAD